MSGDDGVEGTGAGAPPDAGSAPARDTGGRDRVALAVVAVAVLALLSRLVALDARPFHWDEGRVGYWTLRFVATGAYEYRPVAGGPFLYVVNRYALAVLPATDAAARLVVALVGGLLPLAALLFRGRLDGDETVALAAVLAFAPALLYYSRFLRGDLPLAAFGLVAVGGVVRARDTGRRRYGYLVAGAVALALASSGFALVYLACWLVAGLLALDHRRLTGGPGPGERVAALRRWFDDYRTDVAGTLATLLGVLLFFYAPRAGTREGPGLSDPATWPAVVEAAFLGSARKFFGVRIAFRRYYGATHEFLPFLADYVELLLAVALPTVALAAVAALRDRYGGASRPVVAFHVFWAAAVLVAVPVAAELVAPWLAVHTVVPLAVPAAVGLASLRRYGRRAVATGASAATAAAVLLALALAVQAGGVAANAYEAPDADDPLAQYAQPTSDLDPLAADVARVSRGNDGVDVLYFGDRFYTAYEPGNEFPPVVEAWGNRLPLPWYFERAGARTGSVRDADGLADLDERPPVVVADPSHRATLESELSGYEATEYDLALRDRTVVVFVRR